MAQKMQTLKGFRDFLPKQMAIRNRVKRILTDVFESYGYDSISTPSLEYEEVLLGKYGEEADKLVYTFEDRGGRRIGLPYDLTVPIARVASNYTNELPIPFKLYEIQRVWRAENTQKGRYREFEQCEIDILNSTSPISDADVLAVIDKSLSRLTIPNYAILINSRPLLFAIMKQSGIPESSFDSAAISIDKLDKLAAQEVKTELNKKRGISEESISELFNIFDTLAKQYPDGQNFIESREYQIPGITQEIKNLQEICALAARLGVEANTLVPTFTLARGLNYYTGMICEGISHNATGSLVGGGRFDNLINILGGPNWPAVGVAFGLDRICDTIDQLKVWSDIPTTPTQVLITIFSPEFTNDSLKLTSLLRDSGVNAEVYLDPQARLEKQLKYADKKAIPWTVVMGPEEISQKTLILKNLKTGTQETLAYIDLAHKLR